MRRMTRNPNQIAAYAAVTVILGGGWIALYAAGRTGGKAGVLAVLFMAVLAAGALIWRSRARRAAAVRAWYARFHPSVHYALSTQRASLDVVVQPYLYAGLPPLRPKTSALDSGVWHPADAGAAGDAAVRVGLPRGLRPEHLRAAAPALAQYWRVAVVEVSTEPGTRSAAVLTLFA
jgi:hypothetical protein